MTRSSSQPPGASSPDTRHAGTRLSQIALAEKLRSEGYKVANNRLRWLAAVSGLEAGQDGEPDTRARRRPVMARTSRPAPAGRPGQDEDREQRIAALRIRLHETAGQIRSAGTGPGTCGQPPACTARPGRTSC